MTHDPKQLRSVLEVAAPPDLDLSFRAMFGGILAYVDARPLASLSDVGLALKLSGDARADLLAVPGSKPLRYQEDAPESKTYVVVPEAMLEEPDQLRTWIMRAADSMRSAPRAKPGSGRRRQGKPA